MKAIERHSLIAIIVLFFLTGPASAAGREALIIGVGNYRAAGTLSHAIPDAEKIHKALRDARFNTPAIVSNPTKVELDRALKEFNRRSRTAEVAVLYFAGHGVQYSNDNWIVPADARLEMEQDLLFEATRLQDVVAQLNGARLRIIILDACRNNPFAVQWGAKRAVGDGLARIPPEILPVGTVVAFSALAGQKAPDDGAYASALSAAIQTPGLELRQMFERVARETAKLSDSAMPEYTARYEGFFSFGTEQPLTRSIKIYSLLSGLVQKVTIREGSEIKAGQPILMLDQTRIQNAVYGANGELQALTAMHASLSKELEGSKRLFERGEGTIVAVHAAQAKYDASVRDIIAQETKIADLKLQLARSFLTAPASGKVSNLAVQDGDYVNGTDGPNPTLLGLIVQPLRIVTPPANAASAAP